LEQNQKKKGKHSKPCFLEVYVQQMYVYMQRQPQGKFKSKAYYTVQSRTRSGSKWTPPSFISKLTESSPVTSVPRVTVRKRSNFMLLVNVSLRSSSICIILILKIKEELCHVIACSVRFLISVVFSCFQKSHNTTEELSIDLLWSICLPFL